MAVLGCCCCVDCCVGAAGWLAETGEADAGDACSGTLLTNVVVEAEGGAAHSGVADVRVAEGGGSVGASSELLI